MVKIISKLSVKEIWGKIDTADVFEYDKSSKIYSKKECDLCIISGILNFTKTGTSQMGDFISLHGAFIGTNLVTGEKKQSGKLFLPSVAENILIPLLQNNTALEFSLIIGIEVNEKSPVGYSYICRAVIEDPKNPLLLLDEKISRLISDI
jgi:hypothetical protein